LSDLQAEIDAQVQHTIDGRKKQHKQWNQHWADETWRPITPPLDDDGKPRWAPLSLPDAAYPTPPPTLPSEGSQDHDGDVEMQDQSPTKETDVVAGADAIPEPEFVFHIPGAFPIDEDPFPMAKREAAPACRLRYGRGGRCWLEARRKRPRALISRGVVSDSESDEEDGPNFFPVKSQTIFDYRCGLNPRGRPDGASSERRQLVNGEQSATASGGGQQPVPLQQQVSAGSNG